MLQTSLHISPLGIKWCCEHSYHCVCFLLSDYQWTSWPAKQTYAANATVVVFVSLLFGFRLGFLGFRKEGTTVRFYSAGRWQRRATRRQNI